MPSASPVAVTSRPSPTRKLAGFGTLSENWMIRKRVSSTSNSNESASTFRTTPLTTSVCVAGLSSRVRRERPPPLGEPPEGYRFGFWPGGYVPGIPIWAVSKNVALMNTQPTSRNAGFMRPPFPEVRCPPGKLPYRRNTTADGYSGGPVRLLPG